MREELARNLSTQPCKECGGSRLRRSARHVFVEKNNISDVTHMPVGDAHDYFGQLALPGRKGEIAEKSSRKFVSDCNSSLTLAWNT